MDYITNPRGSSRKCRSIERAKEIILDEAYRLVDIRKGRKGAADPGTCGCLPLSAVNRFERQRTCATCSTQMVKDIEAGYFAIHTKYLEEAIAYKIDGMREIERRRAAGITDISDIDPHPDDILIDMDAGEVYTPELNRKDGQTLRALGLKR